MNTGYSFGPAFVFASLGVAFLLIGIISMALRYSMNKQSSILLKRIASGQELPFVKKGYSKYPQVDGFRFRSQALFFGFALTLGLTVVFFNWTTKPKQENIQIFGVSIDEEIEVEIPRSASEPPPPPPPPTPSVIQEVPDEMILEDPVTFVDQSVDANTEVVAAPVVERKKEIAPPPPPPPMEEPDVDEIFKIVEEFPRFPGCEDAGATAAEKKACADRKMLEFIYENIRYPHIALDNGIEGTVIVKFVVEKDGKITGLEILKDIGGECGREALRVVGLMNEMEERWTPGKQRNVPVRVIFNLPVRFKITTRT